eukprot:NODE_5735_length_681_cov_3.162975_g4849_i0.p2 GENE.NODE_5735_length_681_cov_3.162975_g4849_i0~~NODE_5735_length_681_cov_3.162975_g4849_i0.p2  ORF type:complete len:69 (-),score=1.24 NODE_5735_length_681_cov_3.162975_g4849_i0:158-364(-)
MSRTRLKTRARFGAKSVIVLQLAAGAVGTCGGEKQQLRCCCFSPSEGRLTLSYASKRIAAAFKAVAKI